MKNNPAIGNEQRVEVLERILKLECIDKTIVNPNHENERSRTNLKWTALTECGFCLRKLGLYERAIGCFERVGSVARNHRKDRRSLGQRDQQRRVDHSLRDGHVPSGARQHLSGEDLLREGRTDDRARVHRRLAPKTIEIGNEHIHWKCLEQIICLYFILGNFSSE